MAEIRNWSIVVDHIPGQGWEAYIEGDDTEGWEAESVEKLLENVAAKLKRQQTPRNRGN